MLAQIQFRQGAAAVWTSVNPVLAEGEPGVETDNAGTSSPLKFKIGDGIQMWTELPYFSSGSGGSITLAEVLATGIDAADIGADASGAAATALSSATALVSTETARAETAEGLLAPKSNPTFTGVVTGPIFAATGSGTAGRYIGTLSAAPSTGTWNTGDYATDPTNTTIHICTAGGTPGTWGTITGGGGGFTDPMTTEGDLIYYHSGGAARLGVGLAGQVLGSNGTDPAWTNGGVNAISSGTSAYTLVATDNGKTVVAQNTTSTAITIPPNSSVAFPINAQIVLEQGPTAGPISTALGSGVTLTGVTALNSPGGTLVLTQTATNVWNGVSTRNDPMNAVATSGSAQTIIAGQMNRFVLSANCTFTLPPAVAGSSFTAAFIQPASGGPFTWTITGADWGVTGAPTASTVANKKDVVTAFCDDGSTWDVVTVGIGF